MYTLILMRIIISCTPTRMGMVAVEEGVPNMAAITINTTGEDLATIGIIIVLTIIHTGTIMGANGSEIHVIEATISMVANEIVVIMMIIVADITATSLTQDYQAIVT